MCWWLPPPCRCSTGFIATPRTFGHELRLTLCLWNARPALSMGLSTRPPPATMPGGARKARDGLLLTRRQATRLPAPRCGNDLREAARRSNLPLSPWCFSRLLITVPGGMFSRHHVAGHELAAMRTGDEAGERNRRVRLFSATWYMAVVAVPPRAANSYCRRIVHVASGRASDSSHCVEI